MSKEMVSDQYNEIKSSFYNGQFRQMIEQIEDMNIIMFIDWLENDWDIETETACSIMAQWIRVTQDK